MSHKGTNQTVKASTLNMFFIGNGPSRTIPTIINQNYNIDHLCSISDEKPKHDFDDYFFFRGYFYSNMNFFMRLK